MPEQRRRGRPVLPPAERRQVKGLSLSPRAWARLAELAEAAGTTQAGVVESMILESCQNTAR